MLKPEDILFNRGEDGNLLPKEITLETMQGKPTILAKPLTRGKLIEIHQKASSDDVSEKFAASNDIIIEGLIEPKLNAEQIKDLKPMYANAISTAIMAISLGVSQDEVEKKAQELLSTQEADLKKK